MKNAKVNLVELGIRLGLVAAKYPNGRKGAEDIAGISPHTLNRWLAGKSPQMPLLPLAQICRGQNVSMNWLLFGDRYQVELQPKFDAVSEWGARVFEWMKKPDTCERDHYFISEIFELALNIKKELQLESNYPDLILALKGLGWGIKKISANTASRYKFVFTPPSQAMEKESDNEEQHDWVDDINTTGKAIISS